MTDTLEEAMRQAMVTEINRDPKEREALVTQYGKVWDTQEMTKDFLVHGFAAPFCIVTRKVDNKKGSLMFQHWPRYYFDFKED